MQASQQRAVLASGNAGKLRELGEALIDLNIELLPQTDLGVPEADETGSTFIENALIKARNASAVSGLPALADDSGICVDALQGRPGIHSARFAPGHTDRKPTDAENIDYLLELLKNVPERQRDARFVCVLVWLEHELDPEPVIAFGSWCGVIAEARSGQGGFGYDPIFMLPELGLSAAEIGAERKRQLGHRGQALRQMHEQLSLRRRR